MKKITELLSIFRQSHPEIPLDSFRYEASGDTILHCAARQGDHTLCLHLLDHFTPDCRNKDNKTPLHEAAQFGRLEAARVLLSSGADVNALKKADWTPLMLACTKLQEHVVNTDNSPSKRHALVDLLLQNGALVNFQNKDGWTPLHLASREGDLHIIQTLCKHGAQLGKKTKNGNTCLHISALHQHHQAFETLYKLFNDETCLEIQSNQGNYPLHEAVLSRNLSTLKHIINLYPNMQNLQELVNKSGYNILHLAVFIGNLEMINLCLHEKFDIHRRTKDGQNCLHLAALNNLHEVYKLCLSHNVDENAVDRFGRTPCDYIKQNKLVI